MYTFNILLSDELGDRIKARCERTGVTKVALGTSALVSYLDQQDAADALLEQAKSDPAKFAELVKAFGIKLGQD